MKTLMFVICHNCANTIDLDSFNQFANEVNKVVFINNGSTDNTKQLLEHLHQKNKNCIIFNQAFEFSTAEVIHKAYHYANSLDLLNADYLAFWTPQTNNINYDLDKMLKMISSMDIDCISGIRYKNKFKLLFKMLLGITFDDIFSPYKLIKIAAFKRRVLEQSVFTKTYFIELFFKFTFARCAEYKMHYSKGKIKAVNPFTALYDLFLLKLKY